MVTPRPGAPRTAIFPPSMVRSGPAASSMWAAIAVTFSRTRRAASTRAPPLTTMLRRAAPHPHAAAANGAAAVRAALGVALDDRHRLERHAQLIGQDLGERGRVALALRRRADEATHFPRRLDPHRGGIVACDLAHAAPAERSRPHAGELRVRRDANAAIHPGWSLAHLGAPARVLA